VQFDRYGTIKERGNAIVLFSSKGLKKEFFLIILLNISHLLTVLVFLISTEATSKGKDRWFCADCTKPDA